MHLKVLKPYLSIVAALAVAMFFNYQFGETLIHRSHEGTEGHTTPTIIAISIACVAILFGRALTKGTAVPANALYLVLGIAVASFTAPLEDGVVGILYFLASAVLMKGGLEIKLKEFGGIAAQVVVLSFFSLFITAFLFSGVLVLLGVPATGANLTGAIIASTDPAAILPVLGALTWLTARARRARDIAISESAGTDVAGALLVVSMAPIAVSGSMVDLWGTGYASLFTAESGWFVLKQIGGGTAGGLVGWAMLAGWQWYRQKEDKAEEEARNSQSPKVLLTEEEVKENAKKEAMESLIKAMSDVLAFIAALGASFAVASMFFGNVFLAAFLAGLALNVHTHFEHAQHVYDESVDAWVIPFIFVLGGMLVGIPALVDYALVGTVSAFILIFVIRYIAVYAGLAPFMLIKVKGEPMSSGPESKFVASVRQVGAIGIALAAGVVAKNIPGAEGVMPITAWVAFWTLLICTWRNKRVAIKSGLAAEKK